MKKFLKITLITVAIFAALLLALIVALPHIVPVERIRAYVEREAVNQLHRQVKIGKLSIGLWSGLTADDFAISEAPDFSKGTFVSAKSVSVRPLLLPLLSKKIFIKDIALESPNAVLIRYPDGKTYNFSSLSSTQPAATSASQTATAGQAAFLISKAVISDGKINFIDQSPAAQSTSVDGLNLLVRNFTLAGPIDAETSFKIVHKGMPIKIDFSGVINLIKGSAKIRRLSAASGQSKLNATGEVNGFYAQEIGFDMNLEIPGLEPAFIKKLAPLPDTMRLPGALWGSIATKGTLSAMDVTSKLNLGKLAVSANGKIKNVASTMDMNLKVETNEFMINDLAAIFPAAAPPDSVKLTAPMKMQAAVSGTTTNMLVRDIRFDMTPLQITGDGNYKSTPKTSDYTFNLKSNTFTLEEAAKMVPAIQEYQPIGQVTVQTKVFSTPAGADLKGTAHIREASAVGSAVKLSKITSDIDFNMNDAAGTLKAEDVLHDHLSGKNLVIKWDLKNIADLSKISGPATMKMGPGQFKNLPKLTQGSKILRILLMPLSIVQRVAKASRGLLPLPSLEDLKYKEINGDYTLKPGMMVVNSFNLVSPVRSSMKGTVGLVGDQPLDLMVSAEGVDFLVKGTVDDPKPQLDKRQIQKKAINTVEDIIKDPKAGERVKDLLKGIFNK